MSNELEAPKICNDDLSVLQQDHNTFMNRNDLNSEVATIQDRDYELGLKRGQQELTELKDLLTRKLERKDFKGNYSNAIEYMRCGIGSNYNGHFYDNAVTEVLEPIKALLK